MITEFLTLILFITFILLIVGVIKPSVFGRIVKEQVGRKKIALILGTALFVIFVSIGFTAPPVDINKNLDPNESSLVKDSDDNTEEKDSLTDNLQAQQTIEQNENSSVNKSIEHSVDVVAVPTTTTTIMPVIPSPTITPAKDTQYVYHSVVSVTDGDTLKISIDGITKTLRLIGIDTPETVDPRKPVQCFGKEASNKAKELLSGKKVRIETDPTQGDFDKYDRMLVYIWLQDGLFFNEYMIKQGYAHEYTYDLPYKYQSDFKAVQTYARENQLGLWSPNTCNGDTAQTTESPSASSTTSGSSKYYTSSHHATKHYYPGDCSAWQDLSKTYLKVFDSLSDLLAAYPSRTLSPKCSE